jgi:hypothetical protein
MAFPGFLQPLPVQPPVDQGNDFVPDPLRLPGAQEKTRMSPAGRVTRQATVRRNMV